MKELIYGRLENITDLNERKLLKDVFLDVYEHLADYNMDMYNKLEQRLYNEIDNPLDGFAVYTVLEHVDRLDPVSDFFHPMIAEDSNAELDLADIAKNLSGTEAVIASIFMKCDNSGITRFLNEQKIFGGIIKTNQGAYDIKAKAKRCTKYIDEIEKLYRVFQKNDVAWTTVNCPYAYKFVDIVLASDVALGEGEIVKEISVDLGDYDRYKQVNVVPLWNIRAVDAIETGFPMPAKDRINFEHHVSLEDFGEHNGYLINMDSPDHLYSLHRGKELIIITHNSNRDTSWPLLQIENISNLRQRDMEHEVFTNKRNMGFVGRYASVKSMAIRTKGELCRLMQSYEQSATVPFHGFEILPPNNSPKETTDYNFFIDDNIRVDASKKILLMRFGVEGGEDYLDYDKISFLVSEAQIAFPEYCCVGKLI